MSPGDQVEFRSHLRVGTCTHTHVQLCPPGLGMNTCACLCARHASVTALSHVPSHLTVKG